jgi:hemerythrin-like domain-containing protein
MKITDRLKVEHGVFLQQLKIVRELVALGAPREVIAAAVETIAVAEGRHSEIEDAALYPALTRALGEEFPALVAVRAEHAAIRQAVARIRGGDFDSSDVERFVSLLHDHLEHEIHGLFVLAEEWLTEEQLTSMCNWNVEHVYEEAGQRALWMRQWLGPEQP